MAKDTKAKAGSAAQAGGATSGATAQTAGSKAPPPLPRAHAAAPPPLPQRAEPPRPEAEEIDAEADARQAEDSSGRRVARRRPAGPSRNRIAANDDAPSIGGLIYALNQKPSNRPFVYAAFASGLWAALGLGFAWIAAGPDLMAAKSFSEVVTRTSMLTAIATLLGPIALFWFLAALAWRAEELKLRSSAMTEVAVRLAEPDRMAEQSVASLGQAVRRQVSFMNDAVARALGRAGELEALVHNEVASLERSYEDNERKIRGLIQELSGERSALLNTSERVTDTLRHLGQEVPALIEKLAGQQIKLAGIIEGAGQNLTSLETALATQTGALETAIGNRTVTLQAVLEDYRQSIDQGLGGHTQALQATLDSHRTALGTSLDGYMASIDSSIGNRTQALQTVFEEYTRALDTTLANRAQALDVQLVERTKALDNAFSERLRLFDESVLRSTMAIDSAISDKAQALTGAMETHARNLSQVIGQQAVEMDESLMHGINAVRRSSESITRQSIKAIEGLASQSDLLKNVSESLLSQINGVTGRFENQGQAIMQAASALETANYKIDRTLQARHAELSTTLERLTGKAEDIGRVMHGYSSNLEGSMSEAERRARLLTDELARDAEARSRSAIADIERLKSEAGAHTDRALDDLRSRFSTVSQEMSQQLGSLSSNVAQASNEIRQQTARAAAELESEQARLRSKFESLPVASRESTEAIRRALHDQLRALEQLSSLTTREAARRDVSPPVETVEAPPARGAATQVPTERQDRTRALSSLTSTLSSDLAARSRAQQPAPAPTPPQHQPGPQQTESREGWKLGDLLARASLEEEPQPPPAPMAALPAPPQAQPQALAPVQAHPSVAAPALDISIIARALDPATASAIWSRFRTGQRGIMVRSIYTNEGRAAFDEVSRRYRSEPDFQATVNRYIADFERILQDTEQRDQTGRMVQHQLISDTGRVYLFLAHVSGRLS